MRRAGNSWRTYGRLIAEVGALYRQPLHVTCAPDPLEEALLTRFSTELKTQDAEAQAVLERLQLSEKHYRHHLRYIARWGVTRRTLLAQGGNLQLLEKLAPEEEAGALDGLDLGGPLVVQRRQLTEHLGQQAAPPQGRGWLSPMPPQGHPARLYDERDVVWVYPNQEVEFSEGLHPSVARSLIARYLPQPGIVADPMAGGGTVAVEAAQLGHTVWASDNNPQQPYIELLDLYLTDLNDRMGEEFRVEIDLLVLHPPLPETLGHSLPAYTDWLRKVLKHCWSALRQTGHLVLIVPVTADVQVLARAGRALEGSASEVFREDVEELTAMHLAVARNGKEGWHLLVLRHPLYGKEDE